MSRFERKKSSRILNLNFEKIPLPLFHMGQSQGLNFLTRKYKILHLNVAQAAKEVRRLIESRHVMSQWTNQLIEIVSRIFLDFLDTKISDDPKKWVKFSMYTRIKPLWSYHSWIFYNILFTQLDLLFFCRPWLPVSVDLRVSRISAILRHS